MAEIITSVIEKEGRYITPALFLAGDRVYFDGGSRPATEEERRMPNIYEAALKSEAEGGIPRVEPKMPKFVYPPERSRYRNSILTDEEMDHGIRAYEVWPKIKPDRRRKPDKPTFRGEWSAVPGSTSLVYNLSRNL